MTYIKSENIKQNKQRIWGTFKLSDKSTTHFEMKKDDAWYQWGNSTDNLCLTVDRVQELCNEWLENF